MTTLHSSDNFPVSLATSEPAFIPSDCTVLVVDDDADVRRATAQTLSLRGCKVETFEGAAQGLDRITATFGGVVISDIQMPGLDGLEFFSRIRTIDPEIPVILITGHGDIDMAVQAMHDGAYDFLPKPYSAERLWRSVQRASEKRRLVLENRWLRASVSPETNRDVLVGMTESMQRLRQTLQHVANADVDVLVQGETGSGKEVVARALHDSSARRHHPFVAINCGALPDSVFESELFGHEAGAFTGAQKRRIGRIEHSSGGTLFLDEIESMPQALQVKLLRVLESRQVNPLGTNDVRNLDLRVVAATKDDLGSTNARSYFREDLYYRLNVVTLKLPALRDRRADIPLLFARFVHQAAQRFKRPAPEFDRRTLDYLHTHDWPGNVRELVHFAERFVLGVSDLAPADRQSAAQGTAMPLPARIEQYEAHIIREALDLHHGDVRATIAALGIPRKTFYDKLQRHAIERSAYVTPRTQARDV